MTEQFLHRFDDTRRFGNDSLFNAPFVSLEDVQQFQRQINDRGRADASGVLSANFIDFGAADNIYGDRHSQAPCESQQRVEAGSPQDQRVAPRARLEQELQTVPARLRDSIMRDITAMESPGRVSPLSSDQLDRIYNATADLLADRSRTSPLTRAQRELLVAGVFDNAAHPRDIDQGAFNTCNVTTIEERLYTLNPDRAAELVSQVGLTGRYIAPDGFEVSLDRRSLNPDAESQIPPSSPLADGRRNYASQIFSIAVINDHWQRMNPEMRYVQRPGRNGERPREALVVGNREYGRTPDLNITGMTMIGLRLGFSPGFIWGSETARDVFDKDGTIVIRSRQDLRERLQQTQRIGGFPIILGVEADGPMFGRQRATSGPMGHVINIVGYDPERGTVQISNQYGRRGDLQNVRINDLYLSMIPRRLRAGR